MNFKNNLLVCGYMFGNCAYYRAFQTALLPKTFKITPEACGIHPLNRKKNWRKKCVLLQATNEPQITATQESVYQSCCNKKNFKCRRAIHFFMTF